MASLFALQTNEVEIMSHCHNRCRFGESERVTNLYEGRIVFGSHVVC